MMKENIKVQGYVLLDVDVVALNNAGKDTPFIFVLAWGIILYISYIM